MPANCETTHSRNTWLVSVDPKDKTKQKQKTKKAEVPKPVQNEHISKTPVFNDCWEKGCFSLQVSMCFQCVAADILRIRLTKPELEQHKRVVKAEVIHYKSDLAPAVKPAPKTKSSLCSIQWRGGTFLASWLDSADVNGGHTVSLCNGVDRSMLDWLLVSPVELIEALWLDFQSLW